MTNKQFDALVRRRIQEEKYEMSILTENKLAEALRQPEVKEKARRFTMRTAVIVTVILALLCGAALAAVTWSSREFLTYTDDMGKTHTNEELLQYVQPVGQVYEGNALKIEMIDAIFDGYSLVMTWTTESKAQEQAYLLCDILVNGDYPGAGGYRQADELFLQPGEVIQSGMNARTDGVVHGVPGNESSIADACEVTMRFSALTPNGEVVKIGGMGGNGTDADYKAYTDNIERLVQEGNVVIAPDGVIELGSKYAYEEGMTRADLYVAAGVMDLIDTVDVTFTVRANVESRPGLLGSQPIEKDNGDYILRVTRADLTPNTASFTLERVFASKEAAEKYSAYYTEKLGPYWGFVFLDENGENDWYHNGGGGSDMEAPEEQPDGAWVWNYRYEMTKVVRMPGAVTIVPTRDDPETGEYNIPYPEEAVTLAFE